jgi:hypothetical protein
MRGEEIASKCDRKAQGDGTSDQKLCRIYDAICLYGHKLSVKPDLVVFRRITAIASLQPSRPIM